MKNIARLVLFSLVVLGSCIGTDIEGPIPPVLRISTFNTTLVEGGEYQATASYRGDTGEEVEGVTFAWTSSDNDIVTIDNNGKITALSSGTVSITASARGLQDVALLEIAASKSVVTVVNIPQALQVGNSVQALVNYQNFEGMTVDAPAVLWSVSDTSLAKIDQSGVLTAVKSGTVVINAEVEGISGSKSLLISDNPVVADPKIAITSFTNSLEVGTTFMFEATFWDASNMQDDSQTIIWESSNSGIVSIDAGGNARAIAAGTAMIIAKSGDVESESISIIVSQVSTERTGVFGSNSYGINGTFKINKNEAGDVILTIDDYTFGGAPGPYFYLSNSGRSVSGGIKLGLAREAKDYVFNLTEIDSTIDINTFDHLVVWCEPFGITLASGPFN